jgi:signal transduction histidine kinase
MPSWQSIRFRLSVQYSAVVFGLGGALLGLVFLAIRQWLRSQTMTRQMLTGEIVVLPDGRFISMPQLREVEIQAIDNYVSGIVLDQVARLTLIAVIALFLLSLVVGWVMSGRVLKPVEEITNVAREIQASDLSRRIALEGPDDELRRLADTFDGMLERLDRAFTSQRQFLADTSHDLRTPLAVIQSNVELAESDPEASIEDWKGVGGIVRRNTERMSAMIDGLLAAARLQTGRAEAVTIDLAELVEAKVQEMEPIASAADLSVEARTTTAIVQGVEVALYRALANLVDNAQKAAPAGSRVILSSGEADGWAWIAVTDEGPGLEGQDPDDRIGLGLSIVTQIAEGHGGSLATFPGPQGNGTTQVVWVPTDKASGEPPKGSPIDIV